MFANQRARHLLFSISALAFLSVTVRSSAGQTRSPFLGSVPTGQATGTTIELSLKETFARALKYNLGAIESGQNTRAAHAVRLRSLDALLPNLSARVSGALEQINLRAQGFNLNLPGARIPTLVGPFGVADARAYLSQEIFSWSDIQNLKSASESERASQYSYQSDRDLVVFTAANAYLLVISDMATVDSVGAEVKSAQTLYQNDLDLNKEGLIASIDLLRARVELQTQQQRLIAAENQLAIDKLSLARVIGLPNGQEFQLTDSVPYAALAGMTLEQGLKQAYSTRPDYLSAKAQVHLARDNLFCCHAEHSSFSRNPGTGGQITGRRGTAAAQRGICRPGGPDRRTGAHGLLQPQVLIRTRKGGRE